MLLSDTSIRFNSATRIDFYHIASSHSTRMSRTNSQSRATTGAPRILNPYFASRPKQLTELDLVCRKPYIRGCAIVSALCYILTATVIKTPNGAFAITFIRTLVNSAMELFFGLILADHACRNPANSGAIQAAAFGARNLGSVVAYAAGLAIFPPSGGQTVSNAHGIGITAIFPLIIFVLCTWLPNSKLPAADRIGRGEVSVFPVLWMMPLLIWGQLSDGSFSIPPDVWWKVMVALSVVTLGAPLIGARVYYGGFAAVQEAAFNQPLSFFIAAYVFLFNAAPGDAASVAEYQYDAFENNEYYSQ